MYDSGKVIVGLIVFLALITAPLWYNMATGQATYAPELDRPTDATQCVKDSDWMTGHHMDLLNDWRDEVVRDGDRFEDGIDGKRYEKSLSNTCLGCHLSKEKFCDRCHNYVGVEPYCWECHIIPEELGRER